MEIRHLCLIVRVVGTGCNDGITMSQHEQYQDPELKYYLELISSIFHLLSPSGHNAFDFFVSVRSVLLKKKKKSCLSCFLDVCLCVVCSFGHTFILIAYKMLPSRLI